MFRQNHRLFAMDDLEAQFISSLLSQGHAVAPAFFSKELVDRIYAKADVMFHNFHGGENPRPIGLTKGVPLQSGMNGTVVPRERFVELVDPLVNITEILDIVFHESILKIAGQFFRQIPLIYEVSLVRAVMGQRPQHLGTFAADEDRSPLYIFVNLADMDDTEGPIVFIPGTHASASSRVGPDDPATMHSYNAGPGGQRPHAQKPKRSGARKNWVVVRGDRGSIVAVHARGLPAGSIWAYPGDVTNRPRTSIRITVRSHHDKAAMETAQNRMLKWNFDRMTDFQKMFAHPRFVDERIPSLVKAG